MTNTYELMVVYSPEIDETLQKQAFASLKKMVEVGGGSVVAREVLGKRMFTYPIKKHMEGLYALWVVELLPTGPAAVDSALRIDEQVLRYLLIRIRNQGAVINDQGGDRKLEKKEQLTKKVEEKVGKPEKKEIKIVKKVKKVIKKK